MQILDRSGKPKLAYVYTPPQNQDLPIVMFLGGYRSDMGGTKAVYLEQQCKARGQGYVRFDYRGHGDSDGLFEDSTIGDWKEDALAIYDHVCGDQPVILVGSSMGGWIGLMVARERSAGVKAFVGIAAAPDFSEAIYNDSLDDAQRAELHEKGIVYVPNDYSDEPYAYRLDFYEEAKSHLLLTQPQSASHPMRLLQGMKDIDVPYEVAVKIKEVYAGADCEIIKVEEGDHRLSTPDDLELLNNTIKELSKLA